MRNLVIALITLFIFIPKSHAELGPNFGVGVPYLGQVGLDLTMGSNFTLSVSNNVLDIEVDEASVSLVMREIGLKWHPFGGAFFVGAGIGTQTLEVSAEEEVTGAEASVDVTTSVAVARLGWMWGKQDGGLWFGIDVAVISPSGGEVDVEADGLTEADQEFQDVQDAGERFAETSYTNITFARLGYLF